jgi:hypothetical protein
MTSVHYKVVRHEKGRWRIALSDGTPPDTDVR